MWSISACLLTLFCLVDSSRIRFDANQKSIGNTIDIEPLTGNNAESTRDTTTRTTTVATAVSVDVTAFKALVDQSIISEGQSTFAQTLTKAGFDIAPILEKCESLPEDPMSGWCGDVYGSEVKFEQNTLRSEKIVLPAVLIVAWVAIAGMFCWWNSTNSSAPEKVEGVGSNVSLQPLPRSEYTAPGPPIDPQSDWIVNQQSAANSVIAESAPRRTCSLVLQIFMYLVLVAIPVVAVILLIFEFQHASGETPTDMCRCKGHGKLAGDDPFCKAGQKIFEFRKTEYLELRCHCSDQADGGTPPWSEKLVYRPEGVDIVLDMATMVTTGSLTREDFDDQVGNCEITDQKREKFEQLLQLSTVLKNEIKCDEDSDNYDACFDGELVQDRRLLFRQSALARMSREGVATARDQQAKDRCKCSSLGNAPIKEDTLVEYAKKKRIPLSGTMMRDAAMQYCIEEGQIRGKPMSAHFHKLCSAEHWGYCCTELSDREDAVKFSSDKLAKVTTKMMQIADMTEEVLQKSEQLEEEVLKTSQDDNVRSPAKVLLFKLFIVFFHHAQLFLRRQEYCTMHPEDLAACEDPMSFYYTVESVHKELMRSGRAIEGLVSCMRYGARPLNEELDASTYLSQISGVLSNLILRAIHELGTGKLIQRAKSLALSLGKTVWKYRFEIMLAGVVAAGAQPLMLALTSTGITTGVATSWSLVFDQLMRNVVLYVGCPIIQSPLLMSMVLRWMMANIILHDAFIDLVIKPLWQMGKASLGPIGIAVDIANTGFDAIRSMLEKIREKLSNNPNATNATMEVQKTWLETAREFHQTPAADMLYMALSVWVGWIWRTIATVACTAAKVALPVFNGAESAIDAATQGASSYWMKFMGGASNLFKGLIGDPSSKVVEVMQAQNATVLSSMGTVAPKVLGAAHSMLYSVNIVASTSVNVILDVTIGAFSSITQNAVISLGLAHLFSWFFKTWWNPEKKHATVHDRTLEMALDSARSQFNGNTCEGKKQGAKCLYLNQPGLEKEEILEGMCCRKVCQTKETPCAAAPRDERVDEAWDPKAVSMNHLKIQSGYLLNFIRMARVSYGPACEMKGSFLQNNVSMHATPRIAS